LAAPNSTALTSAGYTLSSGAYSKTFGSIVVSFTISDEPDSGLLAVNLNGDVSATDAANAAVSLASLGYPVNGGANFFLSGLNGMTYYGQSL
jgi:hypothetical protein